MFTLLSHSTSSYMPYYIANPYVSLPSLLNKYNTNYSSETTVVHKQVNYLCYYYFYQKDKFYILT